jgi:serine/threonine protein kinase
VERVGEYLVKGVVGEGGMGVVYEGLQPVIGKRVAIKLLKKHALADARESARLIEEARLVNAVGHRGIVDIFSFGELDDGRQYFVMEYLSGSPLSRHIRQHAPLPVNDCLQILDEMLAALSAAHDQGVVHRDIKPSNVFLVLQADGSSYVKVLDFGLAKRGLYAQGDVMQTSASHVMGTPEFMAPEQIRGHAVSPRTDLYSLGVLAFEMLTGQLPFKHESVAQLIKLHLEEHPPAPSSLRPNLTPDVDQLVLKLLEKDAALRPRNCEHVRQQIRFIRAEHQFGAATRLAVLPTPDEPPPQKRSSGPKPKPSPPAPQWLQPGAQIDFKRPAERRPDENGTDEKRTDEKRTDERRTDEKRTDETVPMLPPVRASAPRKSPPRRAPDSDTDRLPSAPTLRPVERNRSEWIIRLGAVGVGALCVLVVQAWPSGSGAPPPPAPLDHARVKLAAPAPAREPEPEPEPEAASAPGTAPEAEQPALAAAAPLPQAPAPTGGAPKAAPRVRGLRFVTPGTPIAEVVAQRLKRVRSAWLTARKRLEPGAAQGFDLALQQCEQDSKTADKLEAMRCLDEFVRLAFDDHEPMNGGVAGSTGSAVENGSISAR